MYECTLSSVTSLPYHSPVGDVITPGVQDVHSTSSAVVLDWSEEPQMESVENMLTWLSACPSPAGIRVYLPASNRDASMQRLQRSLQSLGCTVTRRIPSRRLS